MTVVNSAFTVNGATPTDAVAVAAGSTVTLRVLNTTGINGVIWSVAGNDNSARVNPVITATGNVGATASFVMPADIGDGLGQSYRIQCHASDGGSPANVSTTLAVVGVVNQSAVVPVAAGEELDRDLTYGWTMPFNRALAGPETVAHGAMQPSDGIHGIVRGSFASAAARTAATYTALDVNGVFLQTDTSPPTLWFAYAVTSGVASWLQFTMSGGASTPLTIITSTTVKLWVDSALGASANAWNDQSGNANHFAEATNPPALTTLGSVLCYQGDGIAKRFRNATLTTAVGQWYWMIIRPIAWSGSAGYCGGRTTASGAIFETGSSPQVSLYNGNTVCANTAGAVGSWYRYEALTANAGADYLKIGATTSALGTSGAVAETGWDIFCKAGTAFSNIAIAAIVVCAAKPTAPEIAALNAYGAARWPAVAF